MTTSPRRAREIARTRLDILDAAARAFARGGYKAATMQDIAREAGYTAASLYSYFSSKEEILLELFKQVQGEMQAVRAEPLPAGLTFRQKLALVITRQHNVVERHRDAFRAFNVVGGAAELCKQLEGEVQTPPERFAHDLTPWFEANATPDDIGGMPPRDAALVFAALAHVFFVHWLRGETDMSLITSVDRLIDLYLHGVQGLPKA